MIARMLQIAAAGRDERLVHVQSHCECAADLAEVDVAVQQRRAATSRHRGVNLSFGATEVGEVGRAFWKRVSHRASIVRSSADE